jgi:hypothetical protein
MKAFSYTVVNVDDIMKLIGEVRDHIKIGWEPIGGLSVLDRRPGVPGTRNLHYYQAMVMLELQTK